jgi:hypothetical protein
VLASASINDVVTENAMSEVVDAITTCKFVQTDKVADELVQLSILQVSSEMTPV